MKLTNLTDQPLPKQKKALNLTLRKAGIVLKPGKSHELKKHFDLGQVAAWIHAGYVAVDDVPVWYRKATEEKIVIEVGAMEATVGAGEDGELGTDDDEVEIKPKSKSKKSKKRGKK